MADRYGIWQNGTVYKKNSERCDEQAVRIIIFGCGGHARSIINTIREIDERIDILLVDKNAGSDEVILGCKTRREYDLEEDDRYIIAIGENTGRREIFDCLQEKYNERCISVISPYAHIGIDAAIGCGTFVAAKAYIGPQARVGNNTIINTGSIVEHEAIIGNNTHIAPGTVICGRARIGDNVFCGAGSTIVDKISICDNVVIGAGAVVKENISDAGTYVGIPARKIKD